jgi:hypothetical protein
MATVTLLSAKGSPGASTLAVGLALAWPTEVPGRSALAIDADPAGGDFAAGILGGVLPAGSGMIPLATARGLSPVNSVASAAVHLSRDGAARLLAGVPDSSRAGALKLAWDVISEARSELSGSGTDLVVDAGRLDLSRPVPPWVAEADIALLPVRPTLPAVTAARRFAAAWSAPGAATSSTQIEIIVIDAPSPYGPAEIARAVELPLGSVVPFEPAHARVHSEGQAPSRGFARSAYWRAISGLAASLGSRLQLPEPARDGDPGGSPSSVDGPGMVASC